MVLGFVASGGVVLVLSGGAYAAGSGVDTIAQTTNEVSAVNGQNPAANTIKKVVSVNAVDAERKADAAAAESVKNSLPVANAALSSEDTAGFAAAADIKKQVATGLSKDDATPKNDTAAAVTKADKQSDALAASVVANDLIVADAPVMAAQPDSTITLGSRVFEIQPKITTSHVLPVQDLATSVPTATDQAHKTPSAPAPAKSTGLFSRLTAELAGVVVPSAFHAPAHGLTGLVVALFILAVGALMTGLSGLNFGASMRRSGYVHAARSDVSGSLFSSLFATPMSLSYVTATSPQHSSFFMVSEIKTAPITVPNALRKEEMK